MLGISERLKAETKGSRFQSHKTAYLVTIRFKELLCQQTEQGKNFLGVSISPWSPRPEEKNVFEQQDVPVCSTVA